MIIAVFLYICIVLVAGADQKAPIYSSDEDLSEEESRKRLMKAKRPAIGEVSQSFYLKLKPCVCGNIVEFCRLHF